MIARNTFVIIATQAASGVLGILGLFIISKSWGHHAPGIMGIVWFGFSYVGAFSFICAMGFDSAHVKRVSEGKDLGKCNGTYIAIKLILSGIFVACVVSSILIPKHLLSHTTIYDSARESVIYIFVAYYVLWWLAQIPVMTFNGLKKNVKSQATLLMETISRVLLFVIIVLAGISGAVMLTDSGAQVVDLPAAHEWPGFLRGIQSFIAAHTIGAIAFAYLFGTITMFLCGLFLMRKYPVSRPDREYMGMYLVFAVPMMIPTAFNLLNIYLDKVILGYYWTSVEVGYYFAVQRISTFIMLMPAAIGVVLFPTISSIHARLRSSNAARNRKIAGVTRMSERFISMVTVPLVVTITVFAVPLIDIMLNSSFRPGAISMQVLTLYTYVATMYIPLNYLMLGTNRPKLFAKACLITGLSNIALNFLFIPRNGLLSPLGINGPAGAAIATLLSAVIMFALLYRYSRKIMKAKVLDKRIFLHMAAGIVTGLLLWWLGGFFETIRWYHLGSLSLAGLGIYLAILFGMGEFRKRELDFFMDTMNPASLLRYARDEIRGNK